MKYGESHDKAQAQQHFKSDKSKKKKKKRNRDRSYSPKHIVGKLAGY